MATRLPSAVPKRPCLAIFTPSTSCLSPQTNSATPLHQTHLQQTQTRNADLIRRPKRPYAFTQLVQLSDGSTFTMRTTSPHALYKSTKDTRNHILWNPKEKSLKNIEVDEAGKLAAFRGRFGRSWDAEKVEQEEEQAEVAKTAAEEKGAVTDAKRRRLEEADPLSDLIAGYASRMTENEKGTTGEKGKK